MRRFILAATAIAALAVPALAPALASADVQRYQAATFTVTQPAGQVGQWNNVWTHNYTVTYNPSDGTFTGTGHMSGHDQSGPFQSDETITGSYANGKISFTATRTVDHVSWTLAGAPTDGKTVTLASTDPAVSWPIEAKVTPLQITTYKNHGDYVSTQGGGADAAQSLIGMPINSSK